MIFFAAGKESGALNQPKSPCQVHCLAHKYLLIWLVRYFRQDTFVIKAMNGSCVRRVCSTAAYLAKRHHERVTLIKPQQHAFFSTTALNLAINDVAFSICKLIVLRWEICLMCSMVPMFHFKNGGKGLALWSLQWGEEEVNKVMPISNRTSICRRARSSKPGIREEDQSKPKQTAAEMCCTPCCVIWFSTIYYDAVWCNTKFCTPVPEHGWWLFSLKQNAWYP